MAPQKPLVTSGGTTQQLPNADTLVVGTGIDTAAAGPLTVGTTTANAITIGKSGVTTTFPGPVALNGTVTSVTQTQFIANAQFDGNVTLGNAATDTVTFTAEVDSNIAFKAPGYKITNLANGTNPGDAVNFSQLSAIVSGVSSVSGSGGTTGLTLSGGPTGAVTLTLGGTLGVANGGTGTSTAFTPGSVIFAGASGVYSQNNAKLFWDNTGTGKLGIGTAAPASIINAEGSGTTEWLRVNSTAAGAGFVDFYSAGTGGFQGPSAGVNTGTGIPFKINTSGGTRATFSTTGVSVDGVTTSTITGTGEVFNAQLNNTASGDVYGEYRLGSNTAARMGGFNVAGTNYNVPGTGYGQNSINLFAQDTASKLTLGHISSAGKVVLYTGDTGIGLTTSEANSRTTWYGTTAGSTQGVDRGVVVFNDPGNDYDFRVESDTNANMLFVDASANAVGIGTSTPTSALSVGASSQFQVSSTGDIVAIRGQTTTFPAANAAGVLTNDGSGTLSWAPAGGGGGGGGGSLNPVRSANLAPLVNTGSYASNPNGGTNQRAFGTVYQNTTGVAIFVSVSVDRFATGTLVAWVSTNTADLSGFPGNFGSNQVRVYSTSAPTGYSDNLTFFVPSGSYYRVFGDVIASVTLLDWFEYQLLGSGNTPITTISTTTTLDATYYTVLCSATLTVNLPAAASNTGRVYNIKNIGAAATITIDPNASETIDGATTYTLTTQYESVTIQCNGTAWFIL